mgnify:CR=1 FL=1
MKKDMADMVFEGLLRIGDDNLILGHRTSEWCGHAPTLEEDLALPNIALDLIGHAQALYSIAIQLKSDYKHEDQLAFLRLEHQYKNLLLVEQENGHFGNTILRLFYFSTYMKYFWEQVSINCFFKKLKEFAEKAGRDPAKIELWTSSNGDSSHLDQLVEAGVSQVMVPARPPEQLAERYAQLIADYDLEDA